MNNDVSLQKEELSDELRLLLSILVMDHGAKITFDIQELLHKTDWDKFIELARHHRVFPTLNLKLQKMKSTDIPTFVTQMFHRDYYRNTLQMLALSGEMEQLAKVFSENGIRSIFLKGPVIAADLYGDVSLRTSCDLDFLIPIKDLEIGRAHV